MPEPRYRGESWQASILRSDPEAAAERRAEKERAELEAETKRARAARLTVPTPTPTPSPKRAETPPPANALRALGWKDLSPEALRRF